MVDFEQIGSLPPRLQAESILLGSFHHTGILADLAHLFQQWAEAVHVRMTQEAKSDTLSLQQEMKQWTMLFPPLELSLL